MQVIHNFDTLSDNIKNSCITIGNFDGIHLGHQKILKELKNEAESINGSSILVTFIPHPRKVLNPDNFHPLLSTLKDRLKLIQDIGIDVVILVHFDMNFAEISPEKFIEDYLVKKLNIKKIIIGENYFFGKNKQGNIDLLKKYGDIYNYKVNTISPAKIDEEVISSSKIRNFIIQNNLQEVKKFLGRYYSITGKIVTGSGRGRNIGVPTANLQLLPVLIPPKGVYYTKVLYEEKEFNAVTNIGVRPTFDEHEEIIETHILDFSESVYHKEITLSFIKKIREEKKFSSIDKLKKQIFSDIEKVKILSI